MGPEGLGPLRAWAWDLKGLGPEPLKGLGPSGPPWAFTGSGQNRPYKQINNYEGICEEDTCSVDNIPWGIFPAARWPGLAWLDLASLGQA